jgi:hypothetical protein
MLISSPVPIYLCQPHDSDLSSSPIHEDKIGIFAYAKSGRRMHYEQCYHGVSVLWMKPDVCILGPNMVRRRTDLRVVQALEPSFSPAPSTSLSTRQQLPTVGQIE